MQCNGPSVVWKWSENLWTIHWSLHQNSAWFYWNTNLSSMTETFLHFGETYERQKIGNQTQTNHSSSESIETENVWDKWQFLEKWPLVDVSAVIRIKQCERSCSVVPCNHQTVKRNFFRCSDQSLKTTWMITSGHCKKKSYNCIKNCSLVDIWW